jgi:3-oxoacyl-[acyl-carrier protein] reductase
MARFADRTVVVTGASRGLGRAIATAFAAEAAHVCIGYRARRDDAAETVRLVEECGGSASLMAADLRDSDAVERAIAEVVHERGRIDVLVNNAGIARDALFPMMQRGDWDEVLAVNLTGAYVASRSAARSMLKARRGAIVNVASVAGPRASPGQANYAASKGGLVALTRTLGAELAPRGVRVNAVVPGLLATGMAARLDHRVLDSQRTRIPLARVGEASEVARAVLFLASDEASYVVGQTLVVDGGLSL